MSWMNIYWVIHYFEERDQNKKFHLLFGAKDHYFYTKMSISKFC